MRQWGRVSPLRVLWQEANRMRVALDRGRSLRDMYTGPLMKEMTWTRPEVVAQIRFVEWTGEGRLRLAKFLGLRLDKEARDVHREVP